LDSTDSMDSTAENRPDTPRDFRQVRQVHTITDRFSLANTYIIDDGTLVIVDPGSELNVRLTLAYVQRFLQRSPADIDLIVLTHLHPDHTSGVDALRAACNAPVAASALTQKMAEEEKQGHRIMPGITHFAGQMMPGVLSHLDMFPPSYVHQMRMVNLWLEDVAGLAHHNDWRVIASPGHTPESLCLYNAFTKELLCGDTLITLERGNPIVRGGTSGSNRRQLEETLHLLRNLDVLYLYPGHGRPILAKNPLNTVSVM
jgi:hydroxyacylglutathione hydrolase